MRYFFITQDTGLSRCIQYRDFDIRGGRHLFLKSDSDRLNDTVVLYLAGDGREPKPDFLQRPVTMFSAELKELLKDYEPGLIFKDVVMIHKENSIQYRYVQTLMDCVDVVSGKSEFHPNGMEKRLILDGKKAGRHHLFLPEGILRKDPIVSLPLAESLLRRRVTGIRFEEVEVE